MDVTPLIKSGSQIIQSYGAGSFRVGGQVYNTALMVFPDRVEEWEFEGDINDIKPEDFAQILALSKDLDVVLFGGGEKMRFLKAPVKEAFSEKGIVVEAMDSGAACRTYNVLLAEDRRVAALLLPL